MLVCPIPGFQFQTYAIKKIKIKITMFETRIGFFLQEMKNNETMMAEESCWAITQAEGRSCCGRTRANVMGTGFQPDFLVYRHTDDQMYRVGQK